MANGNLVVSIVVLLAVLAGCQAGPGAGEEEYYLKGERIEQAPEDVSIITLSNSELDGRWLIRDIINRTDDSENNDVNRGINRTQYESLRRTFDQIPAYTESINPNEELQIYVRADGELYQITLWKGRGG
ncbi:hypothetical protein [Haloarchaeobius litoreus]|uniref:Lipoprotein n=1 Tax=Haloarchaeobius litoreus TaxID=755306 RepID=A0ABD6DHN8_9EURY|nr:hypothetical protein [Haloarchaeobius litoreus]